MLKFREESSKLEEERFLAEKTQVLAMRLKRELENVVLEEALPKLVEGELVQQFNQLKELENIYLPRSKKRVEVKITIFRSEAFAPKS